MNNSIKKGGGKKPQGTISITSNGTKDVTEYASANVQVPNTNTATYTLSNTGSGIDMGASNNYRYITTSGLVKPSGTKSITSNGTVDVSSYASVNVNVEQAKIIWSAIKNIGATSDWNKTSLLTLSKSNNCLEVVKSVGSPATQTLTYKNTTSTTYSGIVFKINHRKTNSWQSNLELFVNSTRIGTYSDTGGGDHFFYEFIKTSIPSGATIKFDISTINGYTSNNSAQTTIYELYLIK